jgi:hypothetical protein
MRMPKSAAGGDTGFARTFRSGQEHDTDARLDDEKNRLQPEPAMKVPHVHGSWITATSGSGCQSNDRGNHPAAVAARRVRLCSLRFPRCLAQHATNGIIEPVTQRARRDGSRDGNHDRLDGDV